MTNRLRIILILIGLVQTCIAQSSTNIVKCNREVYGSRNFIKSLPKYICVPENFIIDDYARFSDLNKDGSIDFVAIKYNKREDDQIDGDSTYWDFYLKNTHDTIFSKSTTLSNIVPPFIKDVSLAYLLTHPKAENLFNRFPRRLSHRLSFQLNLDTIRLSYKFDDSYGKSFVFVWDKFTWRLTNIEYFVGELPMYWWRDDDFYYPLNDRLKVIERRKPNTQLSIEDFDLLIAFKYHELEKAHLQEWHIDRIDKTKWPTVDDVKFSDCHELKLPADWRY